MINTKFSMGKYIRWGRGTKAVSIVLAFRLGGE